MFKFAVLAVAIASAAAQYHEGQATHQVSYGGHQASGYGGHQVSSYGGHQAGGYKESGHEEKDYYAEPHYNFAYEVHDSHTGDIKSHKEERKGDHTQGVYMLVEADGSKRVVEYVVEGKSGFNAKVQKEESKHPQAYKTQSSGHGYSSGHEASSYKSYQPSYSSLSSSYKQSSYKPQISYKSIPAYKPETSYQPAYKVESHYSQPAYQAESHYSQPAYKVESHYAQPAYKAESHYSQPAYKAESHYSQPAYKAESHYSQPAYKAESHYSQPAHSSSGHATSSVSFSTHGAKIATSTKHVVPEKHGYESKKY
ncbi:hypothetical protein GE061_014186 [Apolygus lucorum]|uniref:Uncharacterized protein n=1 Tax=Apolygus lucorum TaxID=248454 RepID=A0A8S9XQ63_APOLU|nr:hypothetical protein GE061_014186 [Apolygus lucorum]